MSYLWQTNDNRIENNLRAPVVGTPQTYGCSVRAYTHSHGLMVIEVYKDNNIAFYIGFEDAWYFEGPLRWQGVDFRLGSIDEVKGLLAQGWLEIGDLLEKFAERYLLLILERPTFTIRILAHNVYLGETAPFNVSISFGGDSKPENASS